MTFKLSVNTGFAVNRYSEPEEWIRIVGKDLGVKYAQFTADLLNVSLPDDIVKNQTKRITAACEKYNVQITSTFTGAFTRVNHLAHPDQEIRDYWISWFKKYVDLSVELGATSMGSHFGIFTAKDNADAQLRSKRRAQNIEGWHQIGEYASMKGLSFISWEPMSISREQGETLKECRKLQEDVNKNAPIDFKICLDVDHGDLSSPDPKDTDPYAWLDEFANESPIIHLKQSSHNKGGHWPFTAEHNKEGKIIPEKVLSTLEQKGNSDAELVLELSFRERQPADSTVVEVMQESVNYWRRVVAQ